MPSEIIESNGQAGDGSAQDYFKYRNLSGTVRVRLLDVSISGGRRWADPARFHFELVNNTGGIHGSGTAYKNWGVDGAFAAIGLLAGARSVRLRVRAWVITYSTQTDYNFNTWRAELSWG
ncbi:hypothetical protein [Microbacterium sp. NPDC091662]|uniref:hypothetical protein n=1 Tax=Microbacterium sp. NPDC091662 TaxID=3364211 RepID=UPI00382CFA06